MVYHGAQTKDTHAIITMTTQTTHNTGTLVLQGDALGGQAIESLRMELRATVRYIAPDHRYARLTLASPLPAAELKRLRQIHPFDINALPADFDPTQMRLLLMDMDSTLISIECIDEIADFLAIKPQVAAITEAAMRGEIDFETSLKRRIALIHGLDDSALQHVYNERLQLNPGAEDMLAGLKQRGIRTALVSGGFTYFTERLQQRLDLDYALANELAFDGDGKLTGIANDVIVGARRKADFLAELCQLNDIQPQQVIAMGDGANDLLMMQQAGLSVAYHAKPTVQEQAMTALNHCGLDGVLGLLDIR
jgi:phosphoserine phosphatase